MKVKGLLIVAGALILASDLYWWLVSGSSDFGVVMTFVLGAILFAWGIFYKQVLKLTQKGILRVLKILFVVSLCIAVAFGGFLTVFGRISTVSYDEDAAIVLGGRVNGYQVTSALKKRLDKAVEYAGKNPNAVLVVSGGLDKGGTITEGCAMAKYLMENGISQERIIIEEKATSTKENMKFSKVLLDSEFEGEYKIAIITTDNHIFRSIIYAKRAGFKNISTLGAKIDYVRIIPSLMREIPAIVKMCLIR